MFKLNLKIALRNLWKHKGFTLINVGGLAIGLASCMILLLYVAYEWSFDRQSKSADRIYVVYNTMETSGGHISYAWTPGKMAEELRTKMTGVEEASTSSYPQGRLITHEQNAFKKDMVFATPSFARMLDLKVLKGNKDKMLNDPNGVVLTETMAKNLFANEDPINKAVKFGGKDGYMVKAVIADIPMNSSIRFEYMLPWEAYLNENSWAKNSGFGNNFCLTLVQLQDNSFFDQANAYVSGVYKRNLAEDATDVGSLHPFTKWHLYDEFENGKSVGGKIDSLRIFLMLAFCILLIACINFMNLSTARSEKRAKEVGVRKAIGAARKSLVGQFILESVLLAFISMIVAFVLIEISLPYFNGLLSTELTINYGDWKFWSVLFSLTLITGFLAGSYPAFYLSAFNPVKVLKGFSLPGNSSLSIRKVLVVFQFVFAACLIVCTAVIYQQLNFIKDRPIGFNKNGLVEIPVEGELRDPAKLTLLRDQILKSGAATNVTTFSMTLSQGGNNTTGISWPGKNPKEKVQFNQRTTYYDFAKTVGTEIMMGREFSAQYVDSTNVLINESAVRAMGLKKPLGSLIYWDDETYTVVGVVKDFVVESPYQAVIPMIFRNELRDAEVVVVRLNPTQNISASMGKIEQIFKEINPQFPVQPKFADDNFEYKFRHEKLLGSLSNWFGGFAVFISCLGLLGLALFMAEQRKKEISIRKVLGASTTNILTLLNKDFFKLVIIANIIACPIAYIVISKWLSAYEFRVSITVLPFILAISLSIIIAVLTVSVQSVKVAKSNPIDALKYE